MRDWTKLVLIVCVVALGTGMFVLERRIAGLETELHAARSEMAATHASAHSVRIAAHEVPAPRLWRTEPDAGSPVVPLQPGSPPPVEHQRQPSGVINGIPYYFIPLSQQDD